MPGISLYRRRPVLALVVGFVALALGLVSMASTAASAAGPTARCVAGAPGIGDPYYPTYGNGGYDVRKYDLDVAYDPATDVLDGLAEITSRVTRAHLRQSTRLFDRRAAHFVHDCTFAAPAFTLGRSLWSEPVLAPEERVERARDDHDECS